MSNRKLKRQGRVEATTSAAHRDRIPALREDLERLAKVAEGA